MLKKKEIDKSREFELNEFVPFACQYSEKTLITKNAELLQTIKLSNSGHLSDDDFREQIISSLNELIDPARFAVWMHTVRTKQKGGENEEYSNLPAHVDYLWKSCLPSSLKYKNHIYITFIRDFAKINHLLPHNYLRSLNHKMERKYRDSLLAQHELELTDLTDAFLQKLSRFSPERLEVYEEQGKYYSRQMEFIGKIMHFNEMRFELTLCDYSRKIVPYALGFNNYSGIFSFVSNHTRFYGSVLTFKEAHNLPATALQDLLNVDTEMVIYQSLDFAFGNKHWNVIRKQVEISDISHSRELNNIVQLEQKTKKDFVLQQTGLIIANDSQQALSAALKEVNQIFSDLGIISFNEDVRIEGSYWSSLPANFSFMRRQHSVTRENIAPFTSFGSDKFTLVDDCMFGDPITFFEDSNGFPHALHFLNSGQSNTLLISKEPEKRHFLANLLAAQSAKLGAQVIYYDAYNRYENLIRNIGGIYFNTPDMEKIRAQLNGQKSVIVFNSISHILQSESGHEFFTNFIDAVNDQNAVVISCADYSDNCEALLPNFRTQFFTGGEIEPYANHFDIFEDEIDIINFLGEANLYLKEGYSELVLKFNPPEKLVNILLGGTTA